MIIEEKFQSFLSQKLPKLPLRGVQAVLELHSEGATVPFMARYRKEKTGNLDEVEIRAVLDVFENWNEVIKRQAYIIKEIEKQGNLTDDLTKSILASLDLSELDEIYAPYKKKKKTKATMAREAGIEPLAQWIWDLGHGILQDSTTLEVKAKEYMNPALNYVTYDQVLKGAQDIIVEKINNNRELRQIVKDDFFANGTIVSQKTKFFKNHSKYEMYGDYKELAKNLLSSKTSHRYLAMRRGWQEDELKVSIVSNEEALQDKYNQFACTLASGPTKEFLHLAAKTALTVHVIPSVTNEFHRILKDKADEDAIGVFAENVRRVLMSSPFGAKVVLGVDPGLRTGCKIALIDKSGHFISHTVLQILGESAETQAKKLFEEVFKQIKIDAVAVGNGTAGRETETFLRKIFSELKIEAPIVMVNESGASVYSASDVAREEFPELDITVRGAISIARRLQDPLAELVKIEPKSIGVGQYQHDVGQNPLKKSLEAVVESCVNQVGVDLNTASLSLLRYVSGIGEGLARNIVDHRKTKGLFTDRDELLKVSNFSTKTFEQAAGFLRVFNGKSVLDSTGIHPERYSAVREMAQDIGATLSSLIGEGASKLKEKREKWAPLVGEYTFDDIIRELEKPGRDPRDPFKIFKFREDIHELKDLKEAMVCPGLVTNVTNFGAFVDIGVHQDGLVHISHLSHKFVEDPRQVVSPGDAVTVKVIGIDLDKNQIALSMLLEERPQQAPRPRGERPQRTRPPQAQGDRPQGDRPQRPRRDDKEKSASAAPRADRPQGDRERRPPREKPAPLTPPPATGRPYTIDRKYAEQKMREQKDRHKDGKAKSAAANQAPARDEKPRGPRNNNQNDRGQNRDRNNNRGQAFNNPFAALSNLTPPSTKK
jgi:uncharacterized protein